MSLVFKHFDVVDLRYFKLLILLIKLIYVRNIIGFNSSVCKDKGIRQFEFVTKTQFLFLD